MYLVVPNMSIGVVEDPYHMVDDDIRPGIKIADNPLDKTDSILDIRNVLYNVGEGRDTRCQILDPVPNSPAAR